MLYSIIDHSEQALASTAYRLKNTKEKLARFKNHLTFLVKCRNNSITPKGLRISTSIHSTKATIIVKKSNQALLHKRIKHVQKTKVIFTKLEADTERELSSMKVNKEQLEKLKLWAEQDVNCIYNKIKDRNKQNSTSY